MPRALFRDNLPLRTLTLVDSHPGVDDLIRVCKNKRYGFRLSIPYLEVSLNDFTKLVKECPHVVFDIWKVKAPDSFDIEEYLRSISYPMP